MRFWVRELAGWLLVLLGVAGFGLSIRYLWQHYWIEAGLPSLIGFLLFRGGIHLLKVAVAARVCLQAQDKLRPDQAASKTTTRPARPTLPGRRG
ncbi:MAG TPA: hypothetical protein VKA46_26005 [Gemmataceae bacterium]|nr:hypothetical protein [Gemmataceae bacterium]